MSSFALIRALAISFASAQLAYNYYQKETSVIAELLCWVIVAVFQRVKLFPSLKGWQSVTEFEECSEWLKWAAVTSLTLMAACSSVGDLGWSLPLVTPCLIVLRSFRLLPQLPTTFPSFFRSPLFQIPIGLIGALSLFAFSTSGSAELMFGAFAIISSIALFAMCIMLRTPEPDLDEKAMGTWNFEVLAVIALSVPATALMYISQLEWEDVPALAEGVLFAGCLRAAFWIHIFWMVRTHNLPWEIAPTILTYVSAAHGALSAQVSEHILAQVAVACSALVQVRGLLPTFTSSRLLICFFILISGFPLIYFLGQSYLEVLQVGNSTSDASQFQHPIANIISVAQKDWQSRQERQSKTIEEAIRAYRDRYARDPPPGFDKWFAYARSQNSVLIDDYDLIVNDLKPFWRFKPQQLRDSIEFMSTLQNNLQWREIKKGKFSGVAKTTWSAHLQDMEKLFKDIMHDLPDIKFIMNSLDEPVVIMDPERIDAGGTSQPTFYNESIVTRQISLSCRSSWLNPPYTHNSSVDDYGIGFIQPGSMYEASNACQHPELIEQNGIFISPPSLSITHDPVPILTQSTPLGYNDINYPTFCYQMKYDQHSYKEDQDVPWEDKTNTLYWAGSTTGVNSISRAWRFGQRHRFVSMVEKWDQSPHTYLKETSKRGRKGWEAYNSTAEPSSMNFTIDAKFTNVAQCTEPDCSEQKEYFNIGGNEPHEKMFKSRFLFDLDGNAFSCRYYTLLSSRSAIVKQTIFREWHDERLAPWVHYIPMSVGMEEMPEVLRYFSTEEGLVKAKEIADAGRDWVPKAVRTTDFRIYFYRLLLELARILDPNREVEAAEKATP